MRIGISTLRMVMGSAPLAGMAMAECAAVEDLPLVSRSKSRWAYKEIGPPGLGQAHPRLASHLVRN